MLTLTMTGIRFSDSIRFGPAPHYRVSRDLLIEGPAETVIGKHARGFWEAQGKFFTRYELTGSHYIHFTDGNGKESARYGPFPTTRVPDGHISAPGLSARFLGDAREWHCDADDTDWPDIVFTAA